MAMQRAQNAMTYLTKSKGIDAQRIQVKAGYGTWPQSGSMDNAGRRNMPGSTPPPKCSSRKARSHRTSSYSACAG